MIRNARFAGSSGRVEQCPAPDRPEYAFIGRSNVGKSSLLNALVGRKDLAKTSGKPGKTRLLNHFEIDERWYLVDLPGYGYAKVGKKDREEFEQLIVDYFLQRENLVCTFVLVDSRHEPQELDLEFMEWLAVSEVPFAICFTKADKLKKQERIDKLLAYERVMLESWEAMPPYFLTSAETGLGLDEVRGYIEDLNADLEEGGDASEEG